MALSFMPTRRTLAHTAETLLIAAAGGALFTLVGFSGRADLGLAALRSRPRRWPAGR